MSKHSNILVISDLHLGEDIGPDGTGETSVTERALVSFIDHYAHHSLDGRPWQLVVNGDLVDFIAVCLMPAEVQMLTGLDDDAHWYGIGDDNRAAQIKLRAVLQRHAAVFEAFARFVGNGHQLALVLGNHDAAFHWDGVQDLFRYAIRAHWMADPNSRKKAALSGAQVLRAVEFHPWFWFEEGVAWIEHGHQYDPYCSFEDVLAPATDPGVLDVNVGGVILTYIANHYVRDVSGHWGSSFFGYLVFWSSQSWERGAGILGGYRDMVGRLVRGWRDRRLDRVQSRRARNRIRLERLATRARIPLHVLRKLRRLHERPVASDLGRMIRAVMLDRLVLLVLSPLLLLALLTAEWWTAMLLTALLAPLASFASQARETSDPRAALRRVATRIRSVVQVPIVVFGHSHAPIVQQDSDGWYYNTGSWVPDGADARRAFTHLRIERTPEGARAKLMQWRDGASRLFQESS
ncbi:MAG: hypothetical protein GWP91_22275 [Rhodobacterales bacterium]|nr:hypothetical protein [Rhodobacterales bacterium]